MSRFNTDGPFRALADNTQDCIMRFDRRACYIYVNPFFTHMFQMTNDNILGEHADDIVGNPATKESKACIQRVFDSGEPQRIDHKTVDGQWYDVKFIPEVNGDTINSVLSVARDINANKLLEKELRSAIALRDEFLLIASHELKTPLTTIKLKIQTLLRHLNQCQENPVFSKPIQLCDKIDDYVRKLTTLIDDLLEVSRISAGQLHLNLNNTDLSLLLEEIIDRTSPFLMAAGIAVERKIEPHIMAQVDQLRMEQVMTNLLSNVEKYAPGQPVKIQLQSQSDKVIISVQDQGPGISSNHLKKIFDRFERVSDESSRIGGLGMGLYISRQIIHAHNGKIWAKSVIGQGACFIIELSLTSQEVS
jgi:PAS domain S-box-containing protein